MYNELTEVDIQKMQAEIDEKSRVLRPKIIQDLQEARAQGDLSENYEYKAAKQELRRCDSRLRYLRRMIDTAKVIKVTPKSDVVQLFDEVDILYEEDNERETIRLMTTLRQDAVNSIISKESPLGRAVLGRRAGERVEVRVSDDVRYFIRIEAIRKGSDSTDLPISGF